VVVVVVVVAGQGFSKASSMACLGWHTMATSRRTPDNIHRALPRPIHIQAIQERHRVDRIQIPLGIRHHQRRRTPTWALFRTEHGITLPPTMEIVATSLGAGQTSLIRQVILLYRKAA
jgi:hypothetical protein